jgi:hypothetical protein
MSCVVFGRACDNVVDRAVLPLLAAWRPEGPRPEEPAVLCRRLSLDLNGIAPTAEEVAQQCTARTPREMVRYFMDKKQAPHVPGGEAPYLYVGRRFFADIFLYQHLYNDVTTTHFAFISHLDGLVRRLYQGQIGYDAFAVEALVSPAFLRRFGLLNAGTDLPALAQAAFRIFLGREALPHEAADFGNLWRPFGLRSVSQAEAQALYPECRTYFCPHHEPVLRRGACDSRDGAEALLCQSTVLGPASISLRLSGDTRLPDLDAHSQGEIRKPGRLIVARREFAEAAVDLALRRYLGWWNAGTYRPDFNLPAARNALADFFIAQRYNLRALEEEVLTSVLYLQKQTLGPGDIDSAPMWAFGPSKPLSAEVFLDSVAAVTGLSLGGCDFRYGLRLDGLGRPINYPRPPGAFVFLQGPGTDFGTYTVLARKMGGCPGGYERPEAGGLVSALGKREALALACLSPVATRLVPDGLTRGVAPKDGLPDLLARQFTLAVSRRPTPEEQELFVRLASERACGAGACDYPDVARQLCMGLLASATFNTY